MASLVRHLQVLWMVIGYAAGAILYESGTIISLDKSTESLKVLRNASILIRDDRIAAVSKGPITVPGNTTRIDASNKIIGPGYVDTHHHLWQTAYKTIASNVTLPEYYQKYGEFSPAVQHFSPEDIYLGQLMGCLELLYEGTTTVLDHAHSSWSDEHIDAGVNATFDSGVRAFYAPAVHEIPNGYTWEDQISKIQSLASESRLQNEDSLVQLGLAYDSFYIAPEANITALWNITNESNLSVVTTHHVAGPWAVPNNPTLLQSYGWLDSSVPVVFSHASFISYEDSQILRDTNQYISTTAESEFHYGHVNPTARLIQDQASLGVDTHFTYSSSMVQQARLWLQSLRQASYLDVVEDWMISPTNPMSVEQAYYLITRAGALALRRPDLGAIQVGAKADMVVYRTDAPNMVGWSDPIAAVVLHSDVGDVEDVLVDGQFAKRSGKLVYPDYADVSSRFTDSARRIQSIWAGMEWPSLGDTFLTRQGAPYTPAMVIDTKRGEGTGY